MKTIEQLTPPPLSAPSAPLPIYAYVGPWRRNDTGTPRIITQTPRSVPNTHIRSTEKEAGVFFLLFLLLLAPLYFSFLAKVSRKKNVKRWGGGTAIKKITFFCGFPKARLIT